MKIRRIRYNLIFGCLIIVSSLTGSLHNKRSFPTASANVRQIKKKIKLNDRSASAAPTYQMGEYISPLQNFPSDVWKIITSYSALTGLVRHPFTLQDPTQIIAIDVKTKGKIVQTVLGTHGAVAFRTTRGYVQVHSPINQQILSFTIPYSSTCQLELSEDEQLLHVTSPEQVWDLKTKKLLEKINFESHKAEKTMLHIASQSNELMVSNGPIFHKIKTPKGYKAALDVGDNAHRAIVIPSQRWLERRKRAVEVYDQRTGNQILTLPSHYIRQDCFENGGLLITTSNNQDFIWDDERAIYRVPHKLTDTKMNKQSTTLIGTNECGSIIKVWDIFSLNTPLSVDQTIFLWIIDAYKSHNPTTTMKLADLVKFCANEFITLKEVQRVYDSFNSRLKEVFINTYGIRS